MLTMPWLLGVKIIERHPELPTGREENFIYRHQLGSSRDNVSAPHQPLIMPFSLAIW